MSILDNMYFYGVKVNNWVYNGQEFASIYNVTYQVDSSTSYTEGISGGQSALSPTTFTPTKSGYTFVGWKEDTAANSEVLSECEASDGLTLYAVFKKSVTLTYYDNSTTKATKSGTIYYNNGNSKGVSFTMTQASKSGWTERGWSKSNAGNGTVAYKNGATINVTANTTIYGTYSSTVTASYNGNGNNGGSTASTTGTAYWAPAGTIGATIILATNGFTKKNMNFQKWAQGSASGTQYAAGAEVTITADTTFYATWAIKTLSNYVWKSGSGAGEWTGSYDFTNYTTVTMKLVYNDAYQVKIKAVSPVYMSDDGGDEASITFTPQSGSQSFEWEGKDRPEYGIYSDSMTWKLYITAS